MLNRKSLTHLQNILNPLTLKIGTYPTLTAECTLEGEGRFLMRFIASGPAPSLTCCLSKQRPNRAPGAICKLNFNIKPQLYLLLKPSEAGKVQRLAAIACCSPLQMEKGHGPGPNPNPCSAQRAGNRHRDLHGSCRAGATRAALSQRRAAGQEHGECSASAPCSRAPPQPDLITCFLQCNSLQNREEGTLVPKGYRPSRKQHKISTQLLRR